MSVEEELTRHSPDKDTLLTIGVFDGVHLGHKHLISQLVELAGRRDLLPGVVTFHRNPQEVLSPQTGIPFLTDLEERSRLLEKEGVALVVPLSFTREWAELGARGFVGLLMKHLRMRGLVIGADFALGRGREGDAAALRLLGSEMGFSVDVVPPAKLNGEVVSSTLIRQALAGGDMTKVRRMTGRDFSLHGRVVTGAGRGAGMGIPTANLEIDPEHALPLDGVYATRAYIDGRSYRSMTNIGRNPTFGDSERGVEVYIIDYSGDLYGGELSIDIVERLRGEERFSSVAELKKQIDEDVKKGKAILDAGKVNQV
ncbi:MAG: bifunctional riboflavin kinase/FAD synthetase [Dehalococcoidales bacterium]